LSKHSPDWNPDGLDVATGGDTRAEADGEPESRPRTTRRRSRQWLSLPRLARDPAARLAAFTRQFSVMVDAGIPLVRCLEMLGAAEESRTVRAALLSARADVESGSTLAAALKAHPGIWDGFYTIMLEAGEAGGILDFILQRLSEHLDGEVRQRRVVRAALVYPALGIVAGLVGVAATLQFIVPALAQPFLSTPLELPLATRLAIGASEFVTGHAALIAAVPVALAAGVSGMYLTPRGRMALDGWLLRMPLIGPLLRRIFVIRFARTMATLVGSGVPILEGLDLTARRVGNARFEATILSVKRGVDEGRTIAEPLMASSVFPAEVVQLISVGEQTGALDTMLTKVGHFYDHEFDAEARAVSLRLKAVIAAAMAVIVAALVSSAWPAFASLQQLAR
jgi:type IV pilus assembly protein PilC